MNNISKLKPLLLLFAILLFANTAKSQITISSNLDATPPSGGQGFTATTGFQNGRLNRNGVVSTCAVPRAFPGTLDAGIQRRFDAYTFIPTASQCVTLTFNTVGATGNVQVAVYDENGFNPVDISDNYLASAGLSAPAGGTGQTFSFDVRAGVPFTIVVFDVSGSPEPIGYTFTANIPGASIGGGTPTPTPTPTVTPTPTITPTPIPAIADLSVTIVDSPDPIAAGNNIRYAITLTNSGPGVASNVVLTFAIPANTTFVSVSSGAEFGFTCSSPAVGGTGTITCTTPNFLMGSALFTVTVNVNSGTPNGTIITSSTTVTSPTSDPVTGNNTATATTTVTGGGTGGCTTSRALNLLDFTGDRRADYVVFRPSNNFWYINPSSAASNLTFFGLPFGDASTDVLTPGDYDGDGITDIAVWRRTNGTFYVRRSSDNTSISVQFGQNGDEPVARDYDGDCRTDFAVVRRAGGAMTWLIRNSSGGPDRGEQFGADTDVVAPGDYDGDGRFDLAVFRGVGDQPATFFVRRSSGGDTSRQFGIGSDLVVPGDYDGDRRTDFAVVRTGSAYRWFILRSSDNTSQTVQLGAKPDLTTQNDYDGDGRTDVSVYRQQTGRFFVTRSSDGITVERQFGVNGDYPVANYDTH